MVDDLGGATPYPLAHMRGRRANLVHFMQIVAARCGMMPDAFLESHCFFKCLMDDRRQISATIVRYDYSSGYLFKFAAF